LCIHNHSVANTQLATIVTNTRFWALGVPVDCLSFWTESKIND
jgi:hypothetical protein